MTRPILGAQLYTVRKHCRTLEEVARTLERVRSIGYTAVQVSGIGPVDPGGLARAAREAGVAIAATHMRWDRFLTDLDRLVDEHRLWGCSHAAIGGLPPDDYLHPEGLDRFLAELEPVAGRLAEEGMDFSYHNHSNELARFDGRPWLARLYERAPPERLKAELDTYWIQAGGGDPAEWIRRCAGREPLLHVKDMCVLPDRTMRYAAVGQGNLNWPAILEAASAGGVEFVLVEQDDCYGADPFEELAVSYRALSAAGLR